MDRLLAEVNLPSHRERSSVVPPRAIRVTQASYFYPDSPTSPPRTRPAYKDPEKANQPPPQGQAAIRGTGTEFALSHGGTRPKCP